jgi:uncharacterized protein (TIGR04255 family)
VSSDSFPTFMTPPVVETVLGVEFRPLAGWTVAHFGLFWQEVRSEYPVVESKPPLGSMVERFGREAWVPQGPQLEVVMAEPPARCWYISSEGGQLLQLQRDRLLHNWRKAGDPYPRYPETRQRFASMWDRFLMFLDREGLDHPEVGQCEVTYVNHIERGDAWDVIADAPRVLTLLNEPTLAFLPKPEVVVLDARYVMPDEQGRLRVIFQPAIRNTDGKEILQLTLTARGRPKTAATADLLAWLDLGREWVVRGFVDLTTDRAKAIWGFGKGS